MKSIKLLILVGAFFVVTKSQKNIENYLHTITVIPQPESFTELYFANHIDIPATVIPSEQYSFTFVIHNVEHRDITYPYEVFIEENGHRQIVEKKSMAIKNGQYKNIHVHFSIVSSDSRTEITTRLMNKNQQIDFWVKGENAKI